MNVSYFHCLCMHSWTRICMPTCQHHLDYEVQSSPCHSGSLNVSHYIGLRARTVGFACWGANCVKRVPPLPPPHPPPPPTQPMCGRHQSVKQSGSEGHWPPRRMVLWHPNDTLAASSRRQICVKLKCRFVILSALRRRLTFLKLLTCDKSISALLKRRPSWRGDLICK